MSRYALLATINRYAHEQIPALQFAERDGEVLKELFESRGFQTRHLKGPEATRERIFESLTGGDWATLGPDDLLLFYFAGHGELVGGSYVLHGHSAKPGTGLYSMGLRDIGSVLRDEVPCRHCVAVIDACRSLALPGARGAVGLDAIAQRDIHPIACASRDKLVETIFGCEEGHVSVEDASLGHGVLTYHLAQVMREGRIGELRELFDEACERLREWWRQHRPGMPPQEPVHSRNGTHQRIVLLPDVVAASQRREAALREAEITVRVTRWLNWEATDADANRIVEPRREWAKSIEAEDSIKRVMGQEVLGQPSRLDELRQAAVNLTAKMAVDFARKHPVRTDALFRVFLQSVRDKVPHHLLEAEIEFSYAIACEAVRQAELR